MKTKKLCMKLKLSKSTVAHLNLREIKNLYAGIKTPPDIASKFEMTCGEPTCYTQTGVPCIAC